MKLSEFMIMMKDIQKEAKKQGLDPEVWYASDDEGNSFQPVTYAPQMTYDEEISGQLQEFIVIIN